MTHPILFPVTLLFFPSNSRFSLGLSAIQLSVGLCHFYHQFDTPRVTWETGNRSWGPAQVRLGATAVWLSFLFFNGLKSIHQKANFQSWSFPWRAVWCSPFLWCWETTLTWRPCHHDIITWHQPAANDGHPMVAVGSENVKAFPASAAWAVLGLG